MRNLKWLRSGRVRQVPKDEPTWEAKVPIELPRFATSIYYSAASTAAAKRRCDLENVGLLALVDESRSADKTAGNGVSNLMNGHADVQLNSFNRW
jgi:hypothetical protein